MSDLHRYLDKVRENVLAIDNNIKEVINIEIVTSTNYSIENEMKMEIAIVSNNIDQLPALLSANNSDEYLILLQFYNQYGVRSFVTVYDNEELWDDPKVLKIFSQ